MGGKSRRRRARKTCVREGRKNQQAKREESIKDMCRRSKVGMRQEERGCLRSGKKEQAKESNRDMCEGRKRESASHERRKDKRCV